VSLDDTPTIRNHQNQGDFKIEEEEAEEKADKTSSFRKPGESRKEAVRRLLSELGKEIPD
jgi:hypothetical protein